MGIGRRLHSHVIKCGGANALQHGLSSPDGSTIDQIGCWLRSGPRRVDRCDATQTCRHMARTGQTEHLGRTQVQTCLPNATRSLLISTR